MRAGSGSERHSHITLPTEEDLELDPVLKGGLDDARARVVL